MVPKRQIDGIINLNKPYGITSMEAVRRIKQVTGQKHVGHGGTLDPVATGVIAICFGQATRMMEHLIEGKKKYRTEIEIGVTTDTYDSLGQVVDSQDSSHVGLANIESVLKQFTGQVKQIPPMYSALKRQGKRLYELARAGIEIEREARDVEVYSIELLDWSPPIITVEVGCGRGFYMRSFAHDVGQSLGPGGHLKSLTRVSNGIFHVANSITLQDLESGLDDWETFLYAPDVALYRLNAAIISRRLETIIKNGQPIPLDTIMPHSSFGNQCRAYGIDGKFLAILAFDTETRMWRPYRVFSL